MVHNRPHPTHWAASIRKAARAVVSVRGRPRRLTVHGASMRPTLDDGDRVVSVPWATPRPGHLVALRDPRRPDRVLVKRVLAAGPNGTLDVRGDNPAASTDSRHFGPVPPVLVLGRVVYRYHPPGRAGPVGGAPGSE